MPMKRSVVFALIAGLVPATAATGGEDFKVSVEYTLSPRAAAKMAAMKEKIQARGFWHGMPTKEAKKFADKLEGRIYIGDETIQVAGAGGRIELSGKTVKVKDIPKLQGGVISFDLNSFSARLGGPDNILQCPSYSETLKVAQAQPIKIHCKLIEEN